MTVPTLHNGQWTESPLAGDRGLHYGDGLFETMAWLDGAVRFFDRHLQRLHRGCDALHIQPPQRAVLEDDLSKLELGDQPQVVKLIVTRGSADTGYRPRADATTTRLWQTRPWPTHEPQLYRDGLSVAWLTTILGRSKALAGIKHLNRLEQVLAADELATLGCDEGLLLDDSGAVIEAVSSNVFIRRGDILYTPTLDACGVAGIAREVIMEHALVLGITLREDTLRRADFALADEVFVCNSIRGVRPVRQLGAIELADFTSARALSESLADEGFATCA